MADDSRTVECDFLIVGAGSSGCVLASRLVRQGLKVLLVEDGPADAWKSTEDSSSWFDQARSGHPLAENYLTIPQAGLSDRRIGAFRGRGGGGTSNVNATLYMRGRRDDYEGHWPWSIRDIENSFKSVEEEASPELFKPHGKIGPTYFKMFKEVGFERRPAPADGSHTDGEPTWTSNGFHEEWHRTTTNIKTRRSAWTAFVKPVMCMPNLKIVDDTCVSRVIIEDGRAVGVELVERRRGWIGLGRMRRKRQLRLASPTSEVVLCCGAFRTPKMLMLSGIGRRDDLEEKGVRVIVHSPQVGENLQDHLIATTTCFSKTPMLPEDYSSMSIHGHVMFSCPLPPSHPTANSPTPSAAECPTSRLKGSDDDQAPTMAYVLWDGYRLADMIPGMVKLFLMKSGIEYAIKRIFAPPILWILIHCTPLKRMLRCSRGVSLTLVSVKSRGTVKIESNNPLAAPVIDPRYMTHPDDERAVCEAWRMLRKATRDTEEAKTHLGYEISPGSQYNYGMDDKAFLKYFRDTSMTYFHPVGTCRMGRTVEDSVVDSSSLSVHGVQGLRVADASVAPRIPSTPTQAMAMMIGDRAASLILNGRSAKEKIQTRMLETAAQSAN